jgi:iron complex transport system substrate-binding protein
VAISCAFGSAHAAPQPQARIVAPDWAAAESLLAVGLVPLAIADVGVYRQWLPEIPLPSQVLDLGSRAEPNLELIALLRPQRILISNWQANLVGQFERIAPTETVTIISPPTSPLENARAALRQVARPLGRSARATRYLRLFDDALTMLAGRLAEARARAVIVGVLDDSGHQLYAYGKGSWVDEILARLGLRNALTVPTSRFGNALIDLAQLADTPDARLLYLDQGDRTRRAEHALRQSTLWRSLPLVRAGRTHAIPPFYALGGIPSAWRCAKVMTAALVGQADRARG